MNDSQAELLRLASAQKRLLSLRQADADWFNKHGYIKAVFNINQDISSEKLSFLLNALLENHELFYLTICTQGAAALRYQFLSDMSNFVISVSEHNSFESKGFTENYSEEGMGAFIKFVILTDRLGRAKKLLMIAPAYLLDQYSTYLLIDILSEQFFTQHLEQTEFQFLDVSETINDLQEERPNSGLSLSEPCLERDFLVFKNPQFHYDTYIFDNTEGRVTVLENLIKQSESMKVPAETIALAWWRLLLNRNLDSDRLCLGVMCAGKATEELNSVMGPLSTYIPWLTTLDERIAIGNWLPVLAALMENYAKFNEGYNGNLAKYLDIDTQNLLIFNCLFEYIYLPQRDHYLFEQELLEARYEPSPLKLSYIDGNNVSQIKIDYDTSIYSSIEIKTLAEQFEALTRMEVNPDWRLNQFKPVSESAICIQKQYNLTHGYFTAVETTLPQRLQSLLRKYADHPAVTDCSTTLSYRELYEKAISLAAQLTEMKLQPGDRVAILMDRCVDFYAAMWAVLYSGAIFLPVDKSYPKQRIKYIVEHSGCKIMIVDDYLEIDCDVCQTKYQTLKAQSISVSSDSVGVLASVSVKSPAYIIYTSGTTGRPKGVMVSHESVVAYVDALNNKHEITAGCRYACLSTYAADLGYTAIFGALLSGGHLKVVPDQLFLDSSGLIQYFTQEKPDVLKIVPSHLSALLQSAPEGEGKSLLPEKYLIFGGETLPIELVQKIHFLAPEVTIINHYGPTEATIGVLSHTFNNDDQVAFIGDPISDVDIWVVDQDFYPVSAGKIGQLGLSGKCLSIGYWQDGRLTAEKFIPNPFSDEKGGRLYLTGDLVRLNKQGKVEFVGRIDDQIKLRGYRIELDEVNRAISDFPGVEKTCLIVDKNYETPVLKSFILAKHEIDMISLNQHLTDLLPEYMIPAIIHIIDYFPLTENGKVDKRALLKKARDLEENHYRQPETDTEIKLADIWGSLLKVERVGLDDHFFKLGGHSLLAAQALAHIRKVFDCELNMRDFFANPILCEVAKLIDEFEQKQRLVVVRHTAQADYPLSLAQQRFWVIANSSSGDLAYNTPYQLELKGTLKEDYLWGAFEAVIKRHQILRTRFVEVDGEARQIITDHFTLDRDLRDLSNMSQHDQIIMIDKIMHKILNQEFSLTHDQLFRIVLVRLSGQYYRLLMVVHHIIWDGWSSQIFIRDCIKSYFQILYGEKADLEELPLQYSDYALSELNWIEAGGLKNDLDYWKHQLDGLPTLDLVKNHDLDSLHEYAGSTLSFQLPVELSDKINEFSLEHNTTSFVTMLSIYYLLLMKYSEQDDFAVGTSIANRGQVELEELIGFFVNQLVLRAPLYGNPDYKEFVGRCREVFLDGFIHAGAPFSRVVSHLNLHRDIRRPPLFQVMFVFQSAPEVHKLELNEKNILNISPINMESELSKFDMTLYISEKSKEFEGHFVYNKKLISCFLVESMRDDYINLLNIAIEKVDYPISRILKQCSMDKDSANRQKKSRRLGALKPRKKNREIESAN